MAVVRHRGAVTHQVLVVCHLVVDGMGALVMLEELAERDPRADPMAMPVNALQPLEQARQQRTPSARRQSAAAMRHWAELLGGAASGGFTGSGDPREPRYWEVGFNSPALHLAIGPVAARAGMETSPVLLAAFAIAMSKATGLNPLLVELVVGNRFRRDLERSVSPVIQTGLCLLDIAGVDFDEALARTWRATLAGYKHGYYDPAELAELTGRLPPGRAEAMRNRCGFNDRRMLTSAPVPDEPTPEQLRAALGAGRLNVERRQDGPFEPTYLHVLQLPAAIRLVLCCDTHLLGPADQEAILRAIESTVVGAALRPRGDGDRGGGHPHDGDRVAPVRLDVARRAFDGPARYLADPAHRADLDRYTTDLLRPYGLAASLDGGHDAQSYGEMGEALLRGAVPGPEPVDLLVLAWSVPDARPGRSTATYLSLVCPGRPMSFAICDQGPAAAFTALRLAAGYLDRGDARRAVVLVLEQSTLRYRPVAPVPLPDRHTAVAIHCGQSGAARLDPVSVHADIAPEAADALLRKELAHLPGRPSVVLGGELAAPDGYRTRSAAPGQPDTGVWWTLADRLADDPAATTLVASYDPVLRYLCLAAIGPD